MQHKTKWGLEYFFVRFDKYSTNHHLGLSLKSNRYLFSVGGLLGQDYYIKNSYHIDHNIYFRLYRPFGAYAKVQYAVYPEKHRFNVSFSALIEYILHKSEYGISVLDTNYVINNYKGAGIYHQVNLGLGLGISYRIVDQVYLNAEILCAFVLAGVAKTHTLNTTAQQNYVSKYAEWFTTVNNQEPFYPKIGISYLFNANR
ncbi:MAG TPA: hypothetical protein PLQ93_12210 [Bacteroidia bacterium]|nr:hypothetical protein [Bacteroidia bacterium]